jgi:hypothetical protein
MRRNCAVYGPAAGLSFLSQQGKGFVVRVWRALGARARGDTVVSIETNYTPSHMLCANCGNLMRLVAIEPSPSVPGADEITYRCGFCDHQEKLSSERSIRRDPSPVRMMTTAQVELSTYPRITLRYRE